MSITRNFKLFLNAGFKIPLVIHANQYDQGEQWIFTLYNSDGTQYTPTTASIVGKKSDGNLIAIAETVNSAGQVVVTETEQMTAAAGKNEFELQIDNLTHGTANFIVMVEPDPTQDGVVSESALSLINQAINGGISTTVRQAIYTLFSKAAYTETGLDDELAIVQSWASEVTSISLDQTSISISGAGTVQLTATTVPSGSAVSWASSDTSVATVDSNGIVTSVGNGTATITATSGTKSATCTATISGFISVVSISAVYTQGGLVLTSDSLDDLIPDLVVTATYDDSSTATVSSSDYVLSGSLTEGTATITVAYGGVTTTFTVTVTYDTTPQLALSGYYSYHIANADSTSDESYSTVASANAGTTIIYDVGEIEIGDSYSLCGILPTSAFSTKTFYKTTGKVASVLLYDSNDGHVSYLNALGTSAFTRWLQNSGGTMSEFVYNADSSAVAFSRASFPIDIRYLDDSYMYEGTSGNILFAGRNTAYFGMHNISEAQ